MTHIHKIKYKSTSSHNKICSGMNATNIIYLNNQIILGLLFYENQGVIVSQSDTRISSCPLTRQSFSLFWLNPDKLPNPISFSLWSTPHRVRFSSPRDYKLVSMLRTTRLTQSESALLSLFDRYPNGHPSQAWSFFFLIPTSPCISQSNAPTPSPLNW
jgi:hypothetical protein